jgi:hypothetical protein
MKLLNPTKPNPETVLFFQSFFGNPAAASAAAASASGTPPTRPEPKGVINTLFKPLDDVPEFEAYTRQPLSRPSRAV